MAPRGPRPYHLLTRLLTRASTDRERPACDNTRMEDRPLTFIVRIVAGERGLRGVVERVRTGRKDEIQRAEDVAHVIAAALAKETAMTLKGKQALVTGGSRGIGRGIALKLAESGARVAVHYFQKEDQAKATLEKLRALGADGFVVQADVCKPDEIRRMFARVKSEFGSLDIFVNNARPEVPTFYQGPMSISLDMFDFAMDSQAKAFLVGVREAVPLMRDGGRIIAMTYAPGGRFGSWQPWVAMGAAKAALEVLCRYFAVALAPRQITVNAVSPGWTDDSVLN